MALRHMFVTLCLNLGISVAKQSDLSAVRRLIGRLHPMTTDRPLIRIGGNGDGGYVVPDDFEGVVGCFSPGVDDRATFENEMVARGIPCFLADRSVEKPPFTHELIDFERKFLGAIDDEGTLTLDRWVAEKAPPQGDLVLQMDIEGAEWIVLLNCTTETLLRFRMIVMETHDLERLLDKHALPIIEGAFSRLLEHFILVHNHPNNYGEHVRVGGLIIPRVLELSWIRKDRATASDYARQFPHPLDVINNPGIPDVVLPPEWFGGGPNARAEHVL